METLIIGVLLLASVIGLTFIIERGMALRAGKVIPPAVKGALETCRTIDDLPMLQRICQQHPSPLSRLLLLAEKHRQWPRAENASGLETSARHEISRLERGLVVLEIVVGVAPLLGLVGTIYGLIALFAGVGVSGLTTRGRWGGDRACAQRDAAGAADSDSVAHRVELLQQESRSSGRRNGGAVRQLSAATLPRRREAGPCGRTGAARFLT